MSLITGPAIIINAYLFYHIFIFIRAKRNDKSMAMISISIAVLMSMHLYGAYRLYANRGNDAAPYIAVAEYLLTKPGSTVYVHHFRWPLFLKYFLRYDSSYTFRDLNKIKEEELENLSNVYVVFNRRYLEADLMGRPISQKSFYAQYEKQPPPHWKKVISFSGVPPYNSVVLYFVSPL